ncbi:MAG: TIGR01777 family oxidoreductase [Bryobacteraceae bacterium]|jgi:uncharacterized protein (TIGR01777 family)
MKIVLTGASGFIGARLRAHLTAQGHELVCLSRRAAAQPGWYAWDPESGPPPQAALLGAGAVIHLAGEPVAQRWNAEVKRRILSSRVQGTHSLVHALGAMPVRPGVLVCASAIGYYGSRGDEILPESAAPGGDFLSEVCSAWERAAQAAAELGLRVVSPRIGVVLDPAGGALAQMLPPFRVGLGGPIAGGQAWTSWIHLNDLVRLIAWSVEHPALAGPVNAVAPNPVRNETFTRALGAALHRPAFFPVPALALKLLYGEMAGIVLASLRVAPERAVQSGFQFNWPDLGPALRDLLR